MGALRDIPKMAAKEAKLEKATPFALPLHINSKIIVRFLANHPIFVDALGTYLLAALLTAYYTF